MSTKRLTIEDAKQSFLSRNLILDTNIYLNKNTHMECHDKDGYKYYLTLNNIKDKRIKKFNIVDVRNDYLSFYCVDCHKPFLATWSQITLNKRYRCKTCINKESNNEYIVRQYLEEKGINFIQEKKFKNCKNIKPLPFDFYIPSKNTVIEIHGGQHYYENNLFTQSLQERQRIDNIKKEYCIKNNINYVEIPYWLITESSIETYKQIIDNILEKD